MEIFQITKEMMLKAETYMPLEMKEQTARTIAIACLDDGDSIKEVPFPSVKVENAALKTILLQNTLLSYYFDVAMPDDDDINPYERHDAFGAGNIVNQVERYKTDAECREKAFDVLADFRELKKMIDTDIYNYKSAYNDPLTRLWLGARTFLTPDAIKKIAEEINKFKDEKGLIGDVTEGE